MKMDAFKASALKHFPLGYAKFKQFLISLRAARTIQRVTCCGLAVNTATHTMLLDFSKSQVWLLSLFSAGVCKSVTGKEKLMSCASRSCAAVQEICIWDPSAKLSSSFLFTQNCCLWIGVLSRPKLSRAYEHLLHLFVFLVNSKTMLH